MVLHELWNEGDDGQMFCLAGPGGDSARALLSPAARLVWTVEADSHVEAMTLYYRHMGWGAYTPAHLEDDGRPYDVPRP
ncbi:hypothetical protein FB566_3702 [Stackebrandtia endophytica]|uniref:Uncharacterized protein n=1 Tax=Stackebrandtia endophytica TaxID=1496996 RepID=A0A543AZV9_9ACTN|nr:hypothetical protein [Stackebrandtia endophytica]TQL78125.1 hypothetical protein FB566_3702 [Stackebrandtia endophytica]